MKPQQAQQSSPVCRLCSSEEFLVDIFEQADLVQWIAHFLSIVVSEDDGTSRFICANCRKKLTQFRDFKLRCLRLPEALQSDRNTIVEEDLSLTDGIEPMPPSDEDLIGPIDIAGQLQPVELDTESGESHLDPYEPIIDIIEISESLRKRVDHKEAYRKRLLKCSTCEKMIAKVYMEGHQNKHQGLRPFHCERGCQSLAFHCRFLRAKHYRNTHDGELHECDVCHKSYRSKETLKKHQKDVHLVKHFTCSVCNRVFSWNYRLKLHMKCHSREKNYPCSRCGYSFYTNSDRKKHMRTHESGF